MRRPFVLLLFYRLPLTSTWLIRNVAESRACNLFNTNVAIVMILMLIQFTIICCVTEAGDISTFLNWITSSRVRIKKDIWAVLRNKKSSALTPLFTIHKWMWHDNKKSLLIELKKIVECVPKKIIFFAINLRRMVKRKCCHLLWINYLKSCYIVLCLH